MIPNDQPLRSEVIKRMIETTDDKMICDPDDYTKWEQDFIQSISEQFNKKNDLSDRQCEILERIHDK